MSAIEINTTDRTPRILGVDPGLANMGLALVRLEPDREVVEGLSIIRTKKSEEKKVRVSDDNVRRAQELGDKLLSVGRRFNIVMIAAEAMSFPEDASSAGKMSISWGVLALFARIHGIPIEQASPQAIKRVLCGDPKASKKEVEFALLRRYGNHIEDLVEGPAGLAEHAFDALGAIVAKLGTEAVRQARSTTTGVVA
jgi:crossover junction endodeoxyribonuclease RuvC